MPACIGEQGVIEPRHGWGRLACETRGVRTMFVQSMGQGTRFVA